MCGISGLFDTRGARDFSRDLVRRINDIQSHRGPDESGIHLEPGVALAHRRLSVIDLTTGQQPLFNEDDSVCVVFNGEIYNFQALVPELEALGHRFKTRSDTEVIVHAWESWGESCVQHFRGMFAFVLWDRNQYVPDLLVPCHPLLRGSHPVPRRVGYPNAHRCKPRHTCATQFLFVNNISLFY